MKPQTIINKRKTKEKIIEFCRLHNFSEKKLDELYTQEINKKLYFIHSNDVEPKGLTNDLATAPHPVLIVDINYNVTPTKYTKKYL